MNLYYTKHIYCPICVHIGQYICFVSTASWDYEFVVLAPGRQKLALFDLDILARDGQVADEADNQNC